MTYALIDPPLTEPLTLAETKAHLRLDGTDEDDLLISLIRTAREHLERTSGLCLIAQRWRLYHDTCPPDHVIEITKGPVSCIDSLIVYNERGDETIMPLDGHRLDGQSRPARLRLHSFAPQTCNSLEIDFTAGFGDAQTDVPEALKRAMLTHIALMYEFRGAVAPEHQPADIPAGYERMIAPFMLRRL